MAITSAPQLAGKAGIGPGRTTRRQDLVTVFAGIWLIAGLFLDGYAHQHLVTGGETFFTRGTSSSIRGSPPAAVGSSGCLQPVQAHCANGYRSATDPPSLVCCSSR